MQEKIYLILLTSFLFFSCSKSEPMHEDFSIPVHAAVAEKRDVPIYIDTIGHVEPITMVNIVSRVRGEITGVYFEEGQYVDKDALLFTIDPRTFQANLEKAKGTLEENLANLAFAKDKVERYRDLVKEEYFSQVNYDELITNQKALEGLVKQNQAAVIDAEVNLNYCWIYSPLEGRTGILEIDQGNVIKGDESQTLVVVNQMKPIYVTFFVPEKEIPRIRRYMHEKTLKTHVTYDTFNDKDIIGDLQMLNNQVDEKTGMIKLRSIFANNAEELWPGEFVRTRLILYTQKDAVIIPFEAIDKTEEGNFVYVIEGNVAKMRKVNVGQREGENIIIKEGLKEGEIVITEGMQNVVSGSTVRIKS